MFCRYKNKSSVPSSILRRGAPFLQVGEEAPPPFCLYVFALLCSTIICLNIVKTKRVQITSRGTLGSCAQRLRRWPACETRPPELFRNPRSLGLGGCQSESKEESGLGGASAALFGVKRRMEVMLLTCPTPCIDVGRYWPAMPMGLHSGFPDIKARADKIGMIQVDEPCPSGISRYCKTCLVVPLGLLP